jgi:hypothetical protein
MVELVDGLTFGIFFFGVWVILGLLEVVLLVLRRLGYRVRTISMIARDHGPNVASVVFVWNGLSAHFWLNAERGAGVLGSVLFWVIVAALLGQDWHLRKTLPRLWPTWLRWQRKPEVVMVVALLAGRFLFPQRGV